MFIIVDPPIGPKITNNSFSGSAGMEIFGGSPIISNNNIQGIILIFGGSPVISNNKIEKTDYGINSLDDSANPYISGNVITDCSSAGVRVGLGNATIENNLIMNNAAGVIIEPLTHVTIQENAITNNQIGIEVSTFSSTITRNNIENNEQNINSKVKTGITATENWWGTTDESLISQEIQGDVNFVPFLTEPNPEAPEKPEPTPTPEPTTTPSITPSPLSTPYQEPLTGAALVVISLVIALGLLFYFKKRKREVEQS
jgi:hypothetical protein